MEEKTTEYSYPIENLGLLCSKTKTKDGDEKIVYAKCVKNIFLLLTRHPLFGWRFRFDDWNQRAQICDIETKKWRNLEEQDTLNVQMDVQALYPQFRSVGKDMTVDAIISACRNNPNDEAEDFVRSIKWDGAPRLDTWLSVVYGCADDAYHRAVGSNFFKGIVKRIISPGCKFDTVLMIKGAQGCGKTTSLEVIGGKWYLETTMRADGKDFFMQFIGKMIVEFAEGETMSRTSTKQFKAIVSTRQDTYRVPYERAMKDVQRRCVFAMTTNADKPLKDETGGRRFLPVEVSLPFANIEWLKKNRKQLFAEALHRVSILKESVHEYPKEDTERIQAENLEENPFQEAIEKWLDSDFARQKLVEGLLTSEVWEYALNGNVSRIKQSDQRLIAIALRNLGMRQIVKKDLSRKSYKRWFFEK